MPIRAAWTKIDIQASGALLGRQLQRILISTRHEPREGNIFVDFRYRLVILMQLGGLAFFGSCANFF